MKWKLELRKNCAYKLKKNNDDEERQRKMLN